jgi:hypothetical protein
MHRGYAPLVFVGFLLTAACGSVEWVNPTNPAADYARDYNSCESDATQDPKLQRGNKFLLDKSIERCMAKKGWVMVEKP